jgi:probable O-glycosylation ligase (exosortase A-associated)
MILGTQNQSTQALLTLPLCLVIGILWKLIPHPAVAIAIGLLPLAVLLTLNQPFLMVLLFVVFSFFRIHEVFPQIYNFKIPLLLSMASLGALIWHVGVTRKVEVYWRPELTAITVFFVLVIIGIVMSGNRPIAMEYFKNIYWKIALMTFAIAWLTRTARDFGLASRLITFSGLMVGLVALYNSVNSIGLIEGTRVTIGRSIGSILGDPNDLALVLMFPVAFAVSLIMTKGLGRSTKLLGLVSVPILFLAVIATQSRGGLLGILAVFGVYGYRRIQSKSLFISLALIAAMVLFITAGISGRSSGGAAEAGIDASAMGRLYAWEAAFGMAVDNPLTGVGIDNFYSNYFFYSPHWDGLNHAVHSTWFGVLAETGFLGLGVFITTITLLIRTAVRTLNRIEKQDKKINPAIHATAQAVLAGLVGTVVSGTFLTQGFTWPIYILAALVVAVAHWVDLHLPETPQTNRQGY